MSFPTCCGKEYPTGPWEPGETHLLGYIWWCGDEYCNCLQARIERRTRRTDARWFAVEDVWEGTFFTDGEGYAQARAELNREIKRRHGKVHHHARIAA